MPVKLAARNDEPGEQSDNGPERYIDHRPRHGEVMQPLVTTFMITAYMSNDEHKNRRLCYFRLLIRCGGHSCDLMNQITIRKLKFARIQRFGNTP